MIQHIKQINFYPDKVFIKGIDIVKQGQAEITKQLGMEIINEALSPENERGLLEIVEDKISKFYSMKHGMNLFALNASYRMKPDGTPTKNGAVIRFVSRMRAICKSLTDPMLLALYEPPEAGDKFEYILVKKDAQYSLRGTKIDLTKGDKMEFTRVYRASQATPHPMQIDLNYYMEKVIVGIFARFIAYHPQFQPAGTYDVRIKKQYSQLDKYCVDSASAYLLAMCNSFSATNKKEIAARGYKYRAIYKALNSLVSCELDCRYWPASNLLKSLEVNTMDDAPRQTDKLIAQVRELAERSGPAPIDVAKYIELCTRRMNIFQLKRMYVEGKQSIARIKVVAYDAAEANIMQEINKIIPIVLDACIDYTSRMTSVIERMRTQACIDIADNDVEYVAMVPTHQVAALARLYELVSALASIFRSKKDVFDVIPAINQLCAEKMAAQPKK